MEKDRLSRWLEPVLGPLCPFFEGASPQQRTEIRKAVSQTLRLQPRWVQWGVYALVGVMGLWAWVRWGRSLGALETRVRARAVWGCPIPFTGLARKLLATLCALNVFDVLQWEVSLDRKAA